MTADDQSVANLQRALRGRIVRHNLGGIQPGPDVVWPSDWIFDSAGDDVMVCGPQGKPGFKWLKPDAKSLEARLLYALVAAIIEERGAP